jgi:hypothetical protein
MRRIAYIRESNLQPAILVICLLSLAACEEGTANLAPTTSGTIVGQVTINGGGAAGIAVVLSNGQTATTASTGGYTFSSVSEGAYTVSINGYPADVSFPATVQAAVVAVPSQTVTVNFSGTRAAPPPATQTTITGTLACIGGDTSHDPFVFNAGGGSPAAVAVSLSGNNVTITGVSGFAPSSLPTLSGTVNAGSGAGAASRSGTIAGRSNVSVTASGTLTVGRPEVELVVGGQGQLPGGQPIRYRFRANQ